MNKHRSLILTLTALLAVGFFISSVSAFVVSRNALRTEIQTNTLPLTSDNVYSEIQRDVLRPVFISSLMASDTFLRDWILSGEENPQAAVKYLKEVQQEYGTTTSFLVSERSRRYYQGDGILKTVSAEDSRDTWYFRVRELSENYEINIDRDLANEDAMTIFVNYRVFDYGGDYIGAVGVGLTVQAVKRLLDTYQQKYSRSIFFVDAEGQVTLSAAGIPDLPANILEREGFPSLSKDAAGNARDTYTIDGRLHHVNLRYIPEFDWFLVVEQADDESVAHLWRTLLTNLIICGLITVVVVSLVYMTLRRYQRRIDTLRGIVPICTYCKKVRDDQGFWSQVEAYISQHSEAEFSHGVCPSCYEELFPEDAEAGRPHSDA